jgi:glutathione S-transferase
MQLLGIAYEHHPYTAWRNLTEVRAVNPVGRVPALVLDTGETLFDSAAILDHLDQLVGPMCSLVPTNEPQRHEVLRVVACAMGVLEKVVAALYEQTMRPETKIHGPWLQHNEGQAQSGLAWLAGLQQRPFLAGGSLTQADISTVVMYDFTRIVNPGLIPDGKYPRLDELAHRCKDLPAFRYTFPAAEVDKSNPTLPDSEVAS